MVRDADKSSDGNVRNYSLVDKEPIRLSKGERRQINNQVKAIINQNKEATNLTEKEKNILRQYTGEGGLVSGSKESLNQHYTDYPVIKAIYDALDKAGIKYLSLIHI